LGRARPQEGGKNSGNRVPLGTISKAKTSTGKLAKKKFGVFLGGAKKTDNWGKRDRRLEAIRIPGANLYHKNPRRKILCGGGVKEAENPMQQNEEAGPAIGPGHSQSRLKKGWPNSLEKKREAPFQGKKSRGVGKVNENGQGAKKGGGTCYLTEWKKKTATLQRRAVWEKVQSQPMGEKGGCRRGEDGGKSPLLAQLGQREGTGKSKIDHQGKKLGGALKARELGIRRTKDFRNVSRHPGGKWQWGACLPRIVC